MDVRVLLNEIVEKNASDLYLTTDSPPILRVEGSTYQMPSYPLQPADVEQLANSLMTEKQRAIFEETMEMNLAISSQKLGRFRVNVFRQRGSVAVVIRRIKTDIPSLDDLGLPSILKEIVLTKRGLILVTGATGSGKSTTQAAMIDYRNENTNGHIISVEDPIEFVHPHKSCIVSQREIGFDTVSFESALHNAMRQAPDVILIGEVRAAETMEAAITFSDTGHLCMATLHSNNANQAIERVMNFFPIERHPEIYLQLSLNLRAIVSQRLIPGIDGRRVAALEILIDTPWCKDLIKKGEVDVLKEAMERSTQEGGQTFDHALFNLFQEGRITTDMALANADSANNLRIKIKDFEIRRVASTEKKKPATGTRDDSGFKLEGPGSGPFGNRPPRP